MGLIRMPDEVAEEHRRWAQSAHRRIALGFPILDGRTGGGPAPGELVMFVCRSGVGKTTFGANVAVNTRGIPTVFFSVEMHARAIQQRLAAIYGRTPTAVIEHQVASGQPCPAMDSFVRDFDRLAIVDDPGISLRQMREALEEAADEWGERPRLLIVDYLELVKGMTAMEAVTGLDQLARALKALARLEDVVLVVLHQTNAGAEPWEAMTRKEIRYQVDVPADYTLAAYRPSFNPQFDPTTERLKEREFVIQFLKTRSGGGLDVRGVTYDFDPQSLVLTPPGPALIPTYQPQFDVGDDDIDWDNYQEV